MKNQEITVVLPVYNDLAALETAIPTPLEKLSAYGISFELIVAEDGSADGSRECMEEWEMRNSRVRLLHSDEL